MKLCERFECENYFKPKVTYQIYCSSECREIATKEKIAEKYKSNKRIKRRNKKRKCLGGCNKELSVYNDSGFCESCTINKKQVDKMLKQIKGLFQYEQDN